MSRIFTLVLVVILTTSCDKNKIIYVASTLADCEGNASKNCLQVKENAEDEWTVLGQNIEGFEHKDGFLQKIEVRINKIKNPSADGEVFKYKFIKLIYEQEEIQDVKEVPFSLMIDKNYTGKWKVGAIVGMKSLPKQPTMTFKDGQISGNAGCNNYGANYTLNGNDITFGLANATKMMCSNMKIEKAYFKCLSQAKTYKLVDKLTFYNKEGAELMNCSKIEE